MTLLVRPRSFEDYEKTLRLKSLPTPLSPVSAPEAILLSPPLTLPSRPRHPNVTLHLSCPRPAPRSTSVLLLVNPSRVDIQITGFPVPSLSVTLMVSILTTGFFPSNSRTLYSLPSFFDDTSFPVLCDGVQLWSVTSFRTGRTFFSRPTIVSTLTRQVTSISPVVLFKVTTRITP